MGQEYAGSPLSIGHGTHMTLIAEGINARVQVVGRCIVSSDPFTTIAVLWR
jgi:hypothetical protein